jgi:glycosyltransferase involved in cell wall biosynthesis
MERPPSHHAPTVSIGMPVYNGDNYIREAIDSLLAQTFRDFELLISDNASTDGTQSICEEYARGDARIRYVRQHRNRGGFNNFEYVLDHACGTYFMWAAHDDVWAANWLDTLVSNFTPSDFSVRGAIRFLKGTDIVAERYPADYLAGDYIRFFLEAETTLNARNFYIYGLFDRKQLANLDHDVLSGEYYPDYLFTFQMLQRGCLRTIRGTYQVYRLHSKNAGSTMAHNSVARLVYKVHPFAYYRRYIASAPDRMRPLIALLGPIKHVHNQVHLWWRGFRTVILGVKNV